MHDDFFTSRGLQFSKCLTVCLFLDSDKVPETLQRVYSSLNDKYSRLGDFQVLRPGAPYCEWLLHGRQYEPANAQSKGVQTVRDAFHAREHGQVHARLEQPQPSVQTRAELDVPRPYQPVGASSTQSTLTVLWLLSVVALVMVLATRRVRCQ
eukprot:m.37703 g.37703  ORF g.37703 m.37703 type:complete len:152 (+) comp5850_c0_seq3:32-487(+)